MTLDDIWGWISPFIIWIGTHYSAIGGVTLFLLQVIYQVIRIKRVCTTKDILNED